MIKKIIIHFFIIISILISNIVFSDCSNSCMIYDGPADVLTKYLDNLKRLSNNYNSEISKLKVDNSVSKSYSSNKSSISKAFNNIINWDWYYSLFDFYVIYWTTTEYVPEVWRDYNLLEQQEKSLDKLLKKISSRKFNEDTINTKNLCKWVENCYFDEWLNAISSLWVIIENHKAVMDYYRQSITWKKKFFTKKLLFTPVGFEKDFWTYYNEYTSKNCSSCEWNTFDRVTKQINLISNWQQQAKDWMKSWQDAIAMLDWTIDTRREERIERELLEKELKSQWTNLHQSDAMLSNLDKYNKNWWYSEGNNFITNSFDYLKNSVKSQVDSFKESILENFKKSSKKEVSIDNFSNVEENINMSKIIEEEISSLYNKELPFASFQDDTNLWLEWRILELHYDLNQAIWNLDSTIKVSQKVCNDQWKWLWVCE